MVDTTFPSDHALHFQKNLLEELQRVIMTVDDRIRDEKLQYDIKKPTAKISALSSGKTNEYEYLTGNEILPQQWHIMQEAKFSY